MFNRAATLFGWSQFLDESYDSKKLVARQPAETLGSILTSASHHDAHPSGLPPSLVSETAPPPTLWRCCDAVMLRAVLDARFFRNAVELVTF